MGISGENGDVIAAGINYFGNHGFPIAVCREGRNVPRSPKYPPNLTQIEHYHDFWEIVVINQGQGTHHLEGDSFQVSAGDVFVLQDKQKHFFEQLEGLELTNLLYDPSQLVLPENELRKLPGYCAVFMLEPKHRRQDRFASRLHLERVALAHANQIVEKIEDACDNREAGWEVTALTALQELMIYLSRNYGNSDATGTNALLRVGKVVAVMENEYMKPWKLDDLVTIAHMSRGNLIRVFRNATGQTPIEYLIRIRIQYGMELLRSSDYSITEIAMRIGFNDSNYFSRVFKAALGSTPREFRTRSRE